VTKRITAIVQPLVDILVSCDHSFLAQRELKPGSWALTDKETQYKLLLDTQSNRTLRSGGSGSNSLACAVQLGLTGTCVGLVGADLYGETFHNDFQALGVETPIDRIPDALTGTCLSMVTPDGERTMRTHLGVGVECGTPHIDERHIIGRDWLILEGGHFLTAGEKNAAAVTHAISVANRVGTPVAFNISSEFAATTQRETVVLDLLPKISFFILNESEALALSQQSSAEAAFNWLAKRCPGLAVTCGKEGAYLQYNKQQVKIPAYTAVKAVDSTGAGDAFMGVLLAGLSHNLPVDLAGRGAARLAAEVVAQHGGRLPTSAVSLWREATQNR
jgi:sugar/nucleoside kinase (ribokinase family)